MITNIFPNSIMEVLLNVGFLFSTIGPRLSAIFKSGFRGISSLSTVGVIGVNLFTSGPRAVLDKLAKAITLVEQVVLSNFHCRLPQPFEVCRAASIQDR